MTTTFAVVTRSEWLDSFVQGTQRLGHVVRDLQNGRARTSVLRQRETRGLAIARHIVEAHGGRIWVEPNPGGGAVFCLTLRAVDKEDLGDDE